MAHLNKFDNQSNYNTYTAGSGYVLPDTSYIVSGDDIKYNDYSKIPLTFQIIGDPDYEEGDTYRIILNFDGDDDSYVRGDMEYRLNYGDWQTGLTFYDESIDGLIPGDIVQFRSPVRSGYTFEGQSSAIYMNYFTCNTKFNLFGNLNSLNNYDDTLFTFHYAYLFNRCSGLVSAKNLIMPSEQLAYGCYIRIFERCTNLIAPPKLPATVLAEGCYRYMFYECTSLINTPELPATTLANSCYDQMFAYCTSLTKAPKLPATTLAYDCYSCMFADCTSLTTAPELPAETLATRCYHAMFYNCTSLVKAPTLPATALATGCYESMFAGCTNLTTAPELPVTTLSNACYCVMFSGCTNLTTAPELPATALTDSCYAGMFEGCTSLVTAPELPATTLANNCYEYMFLGCTSLTGGVTSIGGVSSAIRTSACTRMFYGCTSLTTAPALPSLTLSGNCYGYMFYGCTRLTKAPALPATTLENYCYSYMFQGCTGLTGEIVLPATVLKPYCYSYMFQGCTSVNYIKARFITTPSNSYTQNWVQNVSSNGTFVKNSNATWNVTGNNGIPANWTVITAND